MQKIGFTGRVVVVTGAGRGLGRAYAHAFGNRGARVLVNDLFQDGERGGNVAESVAAEIRAAGGEAVSNTDSVGEPDAARRIVEAAVAAFGTVDVVVNNAGMAVGGALDEVSIEAARSVIDCHLLGALAVARAAWPIMRGKRYGRIVNTISTAGLFGLPGMSSYCAGKGGVFGLTKSLAIEGEPLGILVNAISPGAKTRMTSAQFGDRGDRTWRPELVAPAVLYLGSEQCRHNGLVIAAMAGKFSRAEAVQSNGVQFDPREEVSVETFMDRLGDITSLAGAQSLSNGLAGEITGAGRS